MSSGPERPEQPLIPEGRWTAGITLERLTDLTATAGPARVAAELAPIHAVIGSPARLHVVLHLQHTHAPATVTQIAVAVDRSVPHCADILRDLRACGLVQSAPRAAIDRRLLWRASPNAAQILTLGLGGG